MADGLNDERSERVADLLSDFRNLQHHIVSAPTQPPHRDDYYTEGWAALRQCALDGERILNVAADTRVPQARNALEQEKAELQQVMLDAYARRHEAQKIWLRQGSCQRWIGWRDQILRGHRPNAGHAANLAICDQALRTELQSISDESIYDDLRTQDYDAGRWIDEDPRLRDVQRWLRARR